MMKNYRMLALDFDGTLVNSQTQVSEEVYLKLKELLNSGIIITIATGRPYYGAIERVCNILKLKTPQIVLGGAEIISPETKKVLWQSLIDKEITQRLITYLLRMNLPYKIESHDTIFFKDIPIPSKEDSELKLRSFSEFNHHQSAKIIVYPNKEFSYNRIVNEISQLFPSLNLNGHKDGSNELTLNITSKSANKKIALKKVSQMLEISANKIVGVGNGLNDIDLLNGSALKVAMADAPNELKTLADIVIPSAEENGLLELFNKINFWSTK